MEANTFTSRFSRRVLAGGKGPGKIALALFGLVLVTCLLAILGLIVLQKAYSGKVLPGYRVGGISIGGLPRDAAEAKLRQLFASKYGQVALDADGQLYAASAQDLGLDIDASATVAVALEGTQARNPFTQAWTYLTGLLQSQDVPLVVVLDEERLRAYLKAVAQQFDKEASPAQVRWTGAQWELVPSTPGKHLDVDGAAASIAEAVRQLRDGPITLPVVTQEPTFNTATARELMDKASAATGAPLLLKARGKQWTVQSNELAAHIAIVAEATPSLGLDPHWLSTLLAAIAKEVDIPAREASIAWQGDHIVVKDPGQIGWALDTSASIDRITAALNSGVHEVELSVKEVRPKVSADNVAALGIRELIAVGRSYFKGSTLERAHNIKVAAGYLNGVLIAPGETFSFNQAVGDISTARGYMEGYTIVADRTVKGVGGGVCQVSTTVFRAAFWAGLPVVERNPHIYRVGWYEEGGDPVGFDAAIYQPGADLKFTNDTGHYILVQTSVDNGVLSVYFYGTKPPRTVKMDGPYISNRRPPPEDVYEVDPNLPPETKRQVEWAKEGMDVTIYRLIYQDGQLVRKDSFFSRFSPWPNMFKVSPDMAPAAQPTPTAEPTPTATPAP